MTTHPQKILIIRLSSIGDILLSTPLLRILRQKYPNAQIDFIIKKKFEQVINSNSHISNLITFDEKDSLQSLQKKIVQTNYDLIADIHNNFRSRFITLGQKNVVRYKKYKLPRFLLVKFGWNFYKKYIPVYQRYINPLTKYELEYDGKGLEYVVPENSSAKIDSILVDNNFDKSKQTIGMAPGAGFFTKRWPIENFIELAKHFSDKNIILFGAPNEKDLADKIQDIVPNCINLTGQLSLQETAAAIQKCDIMVTNDSGLMHLSNALKVHTVAIFGSTTKELGFFPQEDISTIIEDNTISCRPCTHMGRKNCPKKHFNCMNNLTPKLVIPAVENALKKC